MENEEKFEISLHKGEFSTGRSAGIQGSLEAAIEELSILWEDPKTAESEGFATIWLVEGEEHWEEGCLLRSDLAVASFRPGSEEILKARAKREGRLLSGSASAARKMKADRWI